MKHYKVFLVSGHTSDQVIVDAENSEAAREACRRKYPGFLVDSVQETKLYRDGIEDMKKEWVGKKVRFRGEMYTVVDVDYNGSLMIDLPNQFNPTTAVSVGMIGRIGWEKGDSKHE